MLMFRAVSLYAEVVDSVSTECGERSLRARAIVELKRRGRWGPKVD
jgi:hypothetical protein